MVMQSTDIMEKNYYHLNPQLTMTLFLVNHIRHIIDDKFIQFYTKLSDTLSDAI